MEQIVLNVENKSIIPSLKRVLSSLDGVSVIRAPRNSAPLQVRPCVKKKKTELDLAIEDVQKGHLRTFKSVNELMDYLNA